MAAEIEIRFALDPKRKSQFLKLPLLGSAVPKGCRPLLSTYYDTPRLDLLLKGLGLRIRTGDGATIQTIKSNGEQIGGLTVREEIEAPLDHKKPDVRRPDDSPFTEDLLPLESQLSPIFVTECMRTTWLVETSEGARIELVLDDGEIRANDRALPLLEIELELLAGERAHLMDAALLLAKALPLRPEPLCKVGRGYLLLGIPARFPKKEQGRPNNLAASMEAFFQDLRRHEVSFRFEDPQAGVQRVAQTLALMIGEIERAGSPLPWQHIHHELSVLTGDFSRITLDSQRYCLFQLRLLAMLRA